MSAPRFSRLEPPLTAKAAKTATEVPSSRSPGPQTFATLAGLAVARQSTVDLEALRDRWHERMAICLVDGIPEAEARDTAALEIGRALGDVFAREAPP